MTNGKPHLWRVIMKVNNWPPRGIFCGPEWECRRVMGLFAGSLKVWSELRLHNPEGEIVDNVHLNKEEPIPHAKRLVEQIQDEQQEDDWELEAEENYRFSDVEWLD